MQYMGGKFRLKKYICPILQKYIDKSNGYLEPFVGGCNIASNVYHKNMIASDYNKYLICMYTALQNGWVPPDNISEEEYKLIKCKMDANDPLTAFAGICCSFSGKFFDSYARNKNGRNYALNGKNSLLKLKSKIQNIKFYSIDYVKYLNYNIKNFTIYCDPPYANTATYSILKEPFDHNIFWNWCRQMSLKNTVIVSEYNAPNDFIPIFTQEVKLDMNSKLTRIEKLFIHQSRLDITPVV